jgi:hypothetical protein
VKKINIIQRFLTKSFLILVLSHSAFAEQHQNIPELLFREDFTETSAEFPITQSHLANKALTLSVFGAGKQQIKKSNHSKIINDPFYVWSGLAKGNWMVALKYKKLIDLSGRAKVRWRAKQSGFRQLRLTIKLASGKWLVSNLFDGDSSDWRVKEFNVADILWYGLDSKKITETRLIQSPDLSKIEMVGWTDLMIGGASVASSRVDWIEVYAKVAKASHQ